MLHSALDITLREGAASGQHTSDAERLLAQIESRQGGRPVAEQGLLCPPPSPLLAGSVKCVNDCRTRAGQPKQGNVKCIGLLCADCCSFFFWSNFLVHSSLIGCPGFQYFMHWVCFHLLWRES